MHGLNRRTLRLVLAVVAVVIAVVAVAAVAQENDPAPFSAHKTPTPAVADDVTQNLGVFQRARTADDALPAAAVANLDAVNTQGANADLSRRALVSGDETLYILPADGRVCASLVAKDGTASTGCNYASVVASGANGPGLSIQGDRVTIMGIAADQVSGVAAVFGDGTERSLEIQNNAYIGRFDASQDIKAVAYTKAGERIEFPVTVPDLAAITQRERAAAATR